MSWSTKNGDMDGLNDVSENNRTKLCSQSPVDENICWYDFFKDVGTQVDESDLIQERLDEQITPDNSPVHTEICVTGLAETPGVGNYGQVFGTAKLNTEPRLTFMLPSIRSAFDEPGSHSSSRCPSLDDRHQPSSSVSEPSYTLSLLPPVTSPSMASQHMTPLHVASQPMTSMTLTSAMITVACPPVTSVTITTITSPQITSLYKTLQPMSPSMTPKSSMSVSVTMTLPPVITSASSFLPLSTTKVLDLSMKSKRLSPSDGREVSRVSRNPSPRLSQENIDTTSHSPSDTHDQSREQTLNMTLVKQTSASLHESMELRSPRKTTTKERTPECSTSEGSTTGKCTSGECTVVPSMLAKSTAGKITRELISSEQNIPENITPENDPVEVTEINVPLLSAFEGSCTQTNNLETNKICSTSLEAGKTSSSSLETSIPGYTISETGKTGSASPEMTASTSSAGGWGNEQSQRSVSGKKRRRTGARSSGKSKRRKSRTMMDKMSDDRELRDKLSQRVWDGSSYKIEEVTELSRRGSRAGNLGRVSPNPNTRLRPRKGSRTFNNDDMSYNDVMSSNDVSTPDVVNNDVISNGNIISMNDVISEQPREAIRRN